MFAPHNVYFDASGAPHQLHNKALIVGGFIAPADKWIAFEPRWNKTLDGAGVEYFHMTDLVAGKRQYLGWDRDKQKIPFLTQMAEIVMDTISFAIMAGVNLKDWDKVNQDFELKESNLEPYELCGWSCVSRAKEWCDKKNIDPTKTLYFFEHGEPRPHPAQLAELIEDDLGIIVRTGFKRDDAEYQRTQRKKKGRLEPPMIQFQAADIAAWQALNAMRNFEQGPLVWGIEDWLETILHHVHPRDRYDFQYFSLHDPRDLNAKPSDTPSLIRLCNERSVPKRLTGSVR
jgi:hypothetical protein